MIEEAAVIIVTEDNIPKNIVLVPNGHEEDKAEKVFTSLCEDTFKYTPTGDDLDNGYVEKDNISVAITWPEVLNVEVCENCGALKKSFVHNCPNSSDMPEIYGCPINVWTLHSNWWKKKFYKG